MLALLLMASGAASAGLPLGAVTGPYAVDPEHRVELTLGSERVQRVAVTFAGKSGRGRAAIYLWIDDRWCQVASGNYVRGSAVIDRGGVHRAIQIIDRHERLTRLYWEDGKLVFRRNGQEIRTIDPARACR